MPSKKTQTKCSADNLLNEGALQLSNRAIQRDSEGGERSMAKTVLMFNILYDLDLTEEQGWQFMVLLKAVRASQGYVVRDDYVDMAAYAALQGESALLSDDREILPS